jgi:hypothetical protein
VGQIRQMLISGADSEVVRTATPETSPSGELSQSFQTRGGELLTRNEIRRIITASGGALARVGGLVVVLALVARRRRRGR